MHKKQFPEVIAVGPIPTHTLFKKAEHRNGEIPDNYSGAVPTMLVQTCPYNPGSITTLC
jgi:hypothetical protein